MSLSELNSSTVGLKNKIARFFYSEEVPYGLAITRMVLPFALLLVMGWRWMYARELFSSDGATTPLWINYGMPELLPALPGSVAVLMISALLLFLLTSMIGWHTRFSLFASMILYVYLNLADSSGTMTKYSVIATHILFILGCSRCGAIWSVDSWLKGNRRRKLAWPGEAAVERPKSAAWPRRLLQLLIGCVYFGAGITKIHTPEFFTGEQMQAWLLTNLNNHNPIGEYLTQFPALFVTFAYITIVWEVLFVFMAWRGLARIVLLAMGVLFHVMTTLTLGLYIFPIICVSAYFAFVDESDVRYFAHRLRRLRRKLTTAPFGRMGVPVEPAPVARNQRVPTPALFGVLAMVVPVLGVALEYQLDPYQKRGPEGPLPLVELDTDYVRGTLLAPTKRMRMVDKFSSLDIGTTLVGGVVAYQRREFYHGERITAQIHLNAAHEDMWVECNLHDANDRLIDRVGQIVPRENLRANTFYTLSEMLEPGIYQLVVKAAGQEVMRKSFTLKARAKAVSAN